MNNNYLFSTTAKVSIKVDNLNRKLVFKAIFVENGLLHSHLEYLKNKTLTAGISESWRTQSIQAIRLLLDYATVNKDSFANPKEMFVAFSNRVYEGTIDEKGNDPTALRWKPQSNAYGNKIIYHITQFSDWLYDSTDGESELLNPKRPATKSERILNLAAYNHRINKSFLGHTYSREHKEQSIKEARNIGNRKTHSTPDFDPSKAFREDKIWGLLSNGFAKKGVPVSHPPHERFNLANVLITMLLHFGGLRTSEVFHIYVDDIIPNEGLEQIRIYHPREGLAPEWYRNKTKQPNANRQTFLRERYGLEPRWKHPNSTYNAGWKNSTINPEGKYFNVFMFGSNGVKELFFELFLAYIQTRTAPLSGREHPFLFTNKNGDPLSMDSYQDAHKVAIEKIGMTALLEYGGTPHCHRHAYGTRLKDAGIDPYMIKTCMHHASLESQETYKHDNPKEISHALSKASTLLEKQNSELLIKGYEDV
ncbi:site-specific integrase [Colwellia sp. M166]|uniref:gamma-mobile-trio recombinase GmtY n=1 Tax=Colwellia sp. M166 TaxID=2583805 RepID=UPI00211E6AC6|nr:gamma-mobile-trio recombinase GmtY [Colwellia sp. M166]UUO22055.1 site-specific integrase [Colwellia sp. M166]